MTPQVYWWPLLNTFIVVIPLPHCFHCSIVDNTNVVVTHIQGKPHDTKLEWSTAVRDVITEAYLKRFKITKL